MATKNKKKVIERLNPKQRLFCELYVKNSDLFGNATHCYAEAYNYKLDTLSEEAEYEEDEEGKRKKVKDSPYDLAYNLCSVEGARLLRNPRINDYVNTMLGSILTEEMVDKELSWVINQRKELGPKIQAMKEFNKLKKRVIERVEISDVPVIESDREKAKKIISEYLKELADES